MLLTLFKFDDIIVPNKLQRENGGGKFTGGKWGVDKEQIM